jgi:hypothetical protein
MHVTAAHARRNIFRAGRVAFAKAVLKISRNFTGSRPDKGGGAARNSD